MGDREFKFYKDEKCDICDDMGAFDIYGDCFCSDCLRKDEAEAKRGTGGKDEMVRNKTS